MEANKVDLFMLSKSSMFPNAQLPLLREMLIKASDEDWIKINAASFKNPTTALIMDHPTFRVIRQSCSAYSLSLKYLSSLNPYAVLFITFILLLMPSTLPVDI